MKWISIVLFIMIVSRCSFGQGQNHQWLLGSFNFPQDPKGRMFIDSNSINIVPENRKMPFKGTQGNICDANGNFLMSSNGIWIADATNDTMMNGNGLNPNGITSSWSFGLPMIANNMFLPFPGNPDKYLLMHHTATQFSSSFLPALELYSSTIDITQNGGYGSVTSKNNIIFQDTLGWGIGACRHSNGLDWWVVMMKDSSDIVFKVLVDSLNNASISTQSLGYNPIPHAASSQLVFSQDGSKFISSTYDNYIDQNSYLILADFNRCSGIFDNVNSIQLSSGSYLNGLAFSPSGEFAYACTSTEIFQIHTSTLTYDTVAVYDGFISPPTSTCCPTTFYNMFLAPDGRIYITSGSSVRHVSVIDYPDSAGVACNVQQHGIFIGNYAHLRSVPNHPNYYLGCDSTLGCPCLITGLEDAHVHDFKFTISPNPTLGQIKVIYVLPQNKNGTLEVIDITGRCVYALSLPPWSTLQTVDLSSLVDGIYNVMITSENSRVTEKVVMIK